MGWTIEGSWFHSRQEKLFSVSVDCSCGDRPASLSIGTERTAARDVKLTTNPSRAGVKKIGANPALSQGLYLVLYVSALCAKLTHHLVVRSNSLINSST